MTQKEALQEALQEALDEIQKNLTEIERLKALITELCDALQSKRDDFTLPECEHYDPLIQQARQATSPE